ncbi:MAG: GntR family transcriptional regulator [Lactobacillales bacterium]|jgi:DNA-binding GntR family transcriptional regulator|nr:GntR family transcriptional regulator [Lactobacillales bacterium]
MSTQIKYKQVYEAIRRKIVDGVYAINEKLPDGRALAEEFGMSVLTIKKALDVLVSEGYIVRRRGSGTFVQDWRQQVKSQPMFAPLTGTVQKYENVTTKILGFEVIEADEEIAQKLAIKQGDFVYVINRLRFVDGVARIMEYTCMPISVIPGVDRKVLQHSIYAYINDKLGLNVASSLVRVTGVRPNDLEQKEMGLLATDYLMRVEQIAYLDDGRTFEYSYADNLPDGFEFETVFITRR